MFAETLIYPTQLCGVQVLVGGVAAGLLYVHERQINFKVPQQTPVQGTAEVRVVHRGRSSDPVPMKLGFQIATLTLAEPAYAGMPVWIEVAMPFGWEQSIRYPFSLNPAGLGCGEVEVRRLGKSLPLMPAPRISGGVGGGLLCGSLGLPGQPTRTGRLPLHLLYRFGQSGTYEIKYTLRSFVFGNRPMQVIAETEWTSIDVRPVSEGQRAKWLAKMSAAHPPDAVELLSDYLPSVLGVPDEAPLAILQQDLYHPDTLVRRFAMNGLTYWPETEAAKVLERLMEDKGPSDVVAEFLSGDVGMPGARVDRLVQRSLPYLRSDSPVLLRGAIAMVSRQALHDRARVSAPVRAQAEAAMTGSVEQILRVADAQTVVDFTASLGLMKNVQARELLWKLAEGGAARRQALIAITWQRNPDDLGKLGRLLQASAGEPRESYDLSSLPHSLHRAYGADAIPYLETAMHGSSHTWVRVNCARELILAGRPAGFGFAADAIAHDRQYKMEMMQFVRDRFPELKGAGEDAMLAFLKERGEQKQP